MKYNKVIFLDIDGVINLATENFDRFNNLSMANLEQIIKETDAYIIISSSWRTAMYKMEVALKEHGFTDFLWSKVKGITIRGYHETIEGSSLPIVRGNEIKHWVDRHMSYPWHGSPELKEQYSLYKEDGSFQKMKTNKLNENYTYLILDDDSDMLYEQRNNYIQTDVYKGITEEVKIKAIEILNKLKQ